MKKLTWTLGIVAAACVATAVAQPPAGRGGPGGPQGGPGGPGQRPAMPVIEALDADHDHVISAEELKNATAALLTLDKNNDGKLTPNEFAPQGGPMPGRGQGGNPGGGRGDGGSGRRPGADNAGGPGGRGPGPDGPGGRGPGPDGPGGPGGPGGRGPGAGGPEGGPGGPGGPNPERFVDHAMEFDVNNDGKLSRDELTKFAEEFAKRQGPGGRGGPEAGPNGNGRPERPRRPEE